jgi:hypothetical protein
MLDIYVDADACPVKDEIYRVALRHRLHVRVVSHGPLRVPERNYIEAVRVKKGWGSADDWIVEHAGVDDIVVTADIPLAGRCLKKGARVIGPSGQAFTEDSIGPALATRELLERLREMGEVTGGPPPFAPADRSRFLARLGEAIEAIRRGVR